MSQLNLYVSSLRFVLAPNPPPLPPREFMTGQAPQAQQDAMRPPQSDTALMWAPLRAPACCLMPLLCLLALFLCIWLICLRLSLHLLHVWLLVIWLVFFLLILVYVGRLFAC